MCAPTKHRGSVGGNVIFYWSPNHTVHPQQWMMLVSTSRGVAEKINPNRLALVPLTNDWLPGKQHYHFKSALRVVRNCFLTGWLIDWSFSSNLNLLLSIKIMDEFLTRMYLELWWTPVVMSPRHNTVYVDVSNHYNCSNERNKISASEYVAEVEIRLFYAEACNISRPASNHCVTLPHKKSCIRYSCVPVT